MNNESIQSQGGKARTEALSPEERSRQASDAAKARWGSKANHSYRLPLASGRFFSVEAPLDLTRQEIDRIIRWIELTFVFDESKPDWWSPPPTEEEMEALRRGEKVPGLVMAKRIE